MPIILFIIVFFFSRALAHGVMEHGSQIYHSLILEGDYGKLRGKNSEYLHFKGWVGGDYHKLRLQFEKNPFKEETLITGFYSRNVSEFWDLEAGYAYNAEDKINYFVLGAEGMLPFFIETEAKLYISEKGIFSLELRNEVDITITQRLIFTPYTLMEFYANSSNEHKVKTGLTSFETGILARYELHRKFAPYFSFRYYTKTFGMRQLAKEEGKSIDNYMISLGLRIKL